MTHRTRPPARRRGLQALRPYVGLAVLAGSAVFALGLLHHEPRPAAVVREPPPFAPVADPGPSALQGPAPPAKPEEQPEGVQVEDFAWTLDGFGAVATATFTIRNPTGREARDVAVGCTYFAEDGTVTGSRTRRTYETVPAQSTVTVRGFSMGLIPDRSRRVACAAAHAIPD